MTKNAKNSAVKLARVLEIAKDKTPPTSLSVARFETFAADLVSQEWKPGPRVPTVAKVSSLEALNETPKLVPDEQE